MNDARYRYSLDGRHSELYVGWWRRTPPATLWTHRPALPISGASCIDLFTPFGCSQLPFFFTYCTEWNPSVLYRLRRVISEMYYIID